MSNTIERMSLPWPRTESNLPQEEPFRITDSEFDIEWKYIARMKNISKRQTNRPKTLR